MNRYRWIDREIKYTQINDKNIFLKKEEKKKRSSYSPEIEINGILSLKLRIENKDDQNLFHPSNLLGKIPTIYLCSKVHFRKIRKKGEKKSYRFFHFLQEYFVLFFKILNYFLKYIDSLKKSYDLKFIFQLYTENNKKM